MEACVVIFRWLSQTHCGYCDRRSRRRQLGNYQLATNISPAKVSILGPDRHAQSRARDTAMKPFALSSPASRSFVANARCRSPNFAFFRSLARSGINSRFAITLSSSGTTARGMMWSTESRSPLYGPFITVGALPRLISVRPAASRHPSLSAMSKLRSSASFVSLALAAFV